MPDYTIKCWDRNSFNFDSIDFVREAMSVKQYAAASDYVRLYALYSEGGIYFDSDVEVFRPFNTFLNNNFFCGTEAFDVEGKTHYRMEAAIMGAHKGNSFVKDCMEYYEHNHFIKENGERDNLHNVMPAVISRKAERYNYQYINIAQHLDNGVTIYPTSFFTNDLRPDKENLNDIYAIHHNAGSWIEFKDRGFLYRFCKKNNLMDLYHRIEKLHK